LLDASDPHRQRPFHFSAAGSYNFKMKHLFQWAPFFFLITFLLTGCVKRIAPFEWVSKIPATEDALGPEELFRLPAGERISFNQLIDSLKTARVIFVGESHDQIEQHQIQLRLLQELSSRGKALAIAMEMFERSQQPILDRWSQGLLTEEAFLKEVKWETTWAMDYLLYKAILDEAKSRRLKVLGLNVSKELVRKVAQHGLEGLAPEDKRSLPEMDLSDQGHRAYIKNIYKGHHGGIAKEFEYFYQAQCLRDEGMAQAISDYLESVDGEGKTILVFAGNGHVVFDFGIPKRLFRRTPIPFETIALKEWQKETDEDFTYSGTSSPPANFIWITRRNPPEMKRPRIGVVLQKREGADGLEIERVIPESPAEKAGLLPGDRLIVVEGKEITRVKDIHDALARKGWGTDVIFTVLRDGLKKEIKVILPQPGSL